MRVVLIRVHACAPLVFPVLKCQQQGALLFEGSTIAFEASRSKCRLGSETICLSTTGQRRWPETAWTANTVGTYLLSNCLTLRIKVSIFHNLRVASVD